MITLVEQEKDRQLLLRLCEKTPFGCKIASVVQAYGFDKGFACFWLDKKAETVFCQADELMLISGTVTQPEEAAAFLRAVGPGAVMCAVRNAEALGLPVTDSGDVLKKQVKEGPARGIDPDGVNIREIFGLLEQVGMVKEFEPFYLDISHKLRHGAALAFTEHRAGELAGCAVVSAVSEHGAILSALAVRKEFRRLGIGAALEKRVEQAVPGKALYVLREKEKNREFYKQLGYAKADTWVYSRR